jgi:hypothetical protein
MTEEAKTILANDVLHLVTSIKQLKTDIEPYTNENESIQFITPYVKQIQDTINTTIEILDDKYKSFFKKYGHHAHDAVWFIVGAIAMKALELIF